MGYSAAGPGRRAICSACRAASALAALASAMSLSVAHRTQSGNYS